MKDPKNAETFLVNGVEAYLSDVGVFEGKVQRLF